MSKELELWYRIVEYLRETSQDIRVKKAQKSDGYIDSFEGYPISIIENALKEYEKTKKVVASIPFEQSMENYVKNNCPSIAKKLKALELLKNRDVSLPYLKCCDTFEQYKTICSYWNEITQEEFDLLKEVLK